MIRIVLLLLLILMLTAECAPLPKDGTPAKVNAPQAIEQCHAQPKLDWCKP